MAIRTKPLTAGSPAGQLKPSKTAEVSSILIMGESWIARHGLKQLIADEVRGVRFGEVENTEEAIGQLEGYPWGLVMIDISTNANRGLAILDKILLHRSEARVLVLSVHFNESDATRVARSGAAGYLPMSGSRTQFVNRFKRILTGESYFGGIKPLEVNPSGPAHSGLSARELNVLMALATGLRPREIAMDLKLSIKTVSTYKRRIFNKMAISSLADIVRYAIDHQLLPQDASVGQLSPSFRELRPISKPAGTATASRLEAVDAETSRNAAN